MRRNILWLLAVLSSVVDLERHRSVNAASGF